MHQDLILPIPDHGSLRGVRYGTSVHIFLGVPYALPPVGPRRWQKTIPLPPDFSYGTEGNPYDCTKFGPICPQPNYMMNGKSLSAVQGPSVRCPKSHLHLPIVVFSKSLTLVQASEDYLLLNIWTPASGRQSEDGWPVYVWLHGGWLQMGNPCHTPHSDPWELIDETSADLKAIVIAVGYRLNIFGFLAEQGVDGNFGFCVNDACLPGARPGV